MFHRAPARLRSKKSNETVHLIVVTSFLFAAFGAVLAYGGTELVFLGGSAYYLVAGVTFLAVAGLLLARCRIVLPIFGLFVLGSLA